MGKRFAKLDTFVFSKRNAKSAAPIEFDVDPGLFKQFGCEFRVELERLAPELTKALVRVGFDVRSKHSGRRPRSFGSESSSIDDRDPPGALLLQLPSDAQSD